MFLGAALCMLWALSIAPADRSFTLGVPASTVVAKVKGSDEVCQTGIRVPEHDGFRTIRLTLGTYGNAGPRTSVQVRHGSRLVASGVIPSGYPDIGPEPFHIVRLDRDVAAAESVDVCIRARGRHSLAVYGGSGAPNTELTRNGTTVPGDLSLVFGCGCDRSKLSRIGPALDASALFKLQGGSTIPVFLLLLGVLVVVPLLLWRAAGPPRR